ncbi:MAG TPA: hypothetical protein VMK12_27085 [Anaeromyxobacteraceae bacterium]|nr:hypothetical protein [Anaeromyxobacteraceae bacterium]
MTSVPESMKASNSTANFFGEVLELGAKQDRSCAFDMDDKFETDTGHVELHVVGW